MQSIPLGVSLLLLTLVAACGDAASPGKDNAPQTGPGASSAPGPWDTLAALAPEDQPYGLDVYTAKCASCHGTLGEGKGTNPALTHLSPTATQRTLLNYRDGKIPGGKAAGKAGLSDAEIAAVAMYTGV